MLEQRCAESGWATRLGLGIPRGYYSGKVYHMMLGVKHAGPCGFRKMRSLIFVELLQGVLPNASAVIGLD